MARTETVQLVRDRWAVLCGLDPTTLITDDATAFLTFLNLAIRESWMRAEWAFVTKTTGHITNDFGMVDLSSNTEISEVLRAYDTHPYRFDSAVELPQIPVEDSEIDGVFIPNAPTVVSLTVSSITRSSTTATVTTSTDHNLLAGQSVIIAGAGQSEYNGTFVVLAVTSSTIFTYTVSGSPATPATGTITAKKATVYLFSRIRETVYSSVSETVPFKLSRFLSYSASGNWLKSEGFEEKGALRLQEAERILLDEIDRLERQQNHKPPINYKVRIAGIA